MNGISGIDGSVGNFVRDLMSEAREVAEHKNGSTDTVSIDPRTIERYAAQSGETELLADEDVFPVLGSVVAGIHEGGKEMMNLHTGLDADRVYRLVGMFD